MARDTRKVKGQPEPVAIGRRRGASTGLRLVIVAGTAIAFTAACSSSVSVKASGKKANGSASSTVPGETTTTAAGSNDAATTTTAAGSGAPAKTATGAGGAGSGSPAPKVASPAGPCSSSAPGGVLSSSCDTSTPSEQLTGAGANSAQPFFARVFYYFNQADHAVTVNYSPVGSSVGVSDIQQGTVQFGQSEIPIPTPASGSGGAILQVPVDLGGVALSYNVPGINGGLHLDGPTLANIYLGNITHWNDPAIANLNPGITLPSTTIIAVHRADSSGPGYDLDQYLIDTGGPAWTAKAGNSSSTHWPVSNVGVGQQLNTGVASYIQQNPGAIGYVEYAYALQANFNNIALRNQTGSFVTPSRTSIAAAGANAASLSASNFNIINGPGAGTYPLANFSWTLLYQKQSNANVGIALGKLFDWVSTTGQQQASTLGYAPLPANVVTLAHQTLLQLDGPNGQPLFTG
ncbi:MAG TPA: phosphate ABC transporter substrate-binding protein PstS [Acidimicrobiales bacterium]